MVGDDESGNNGQNEPKRLIKEGVVIFILTFVYKFKSHLFSNILKKFIIT